MKTVTIMAEPGKAEAATFLPALKLAMRELGEIRRANKAADAEIRRLQAATRKKLSGIKENLRHVEAVR